IGCNATTASRKMIVSAASRIVSAISLGVFCRAAPSTSAIMRSTNDSPRLDDHEVADGQLGAADPRFDPVDELARRRLLLGAPQRLGLGFAPALRDGF